MFIVDGLKRKITLTDFCILINDNKIDKKKNSGF